jgi:hypothetical protein
MARYTKRMDPSRTAKLPHAKPPRNGSDDGATKLPASSQSPYDEFVMRPQHWMR